MIALRRTSAGPGPFVLMAKNQSPLFQIVGRDLDRHPITCKSLYPVLFHPSGRVGDQLMTIVELNPVPRIGEDFGDQTFEFQKLFFRQVVSPFAGGRRASG